ncbi:MAG: helix-turn-helix domain-containing protein, partial [Bacteroidota bacterium]
MTQRRSTILEVALDLFARQGYDSTSTSKIAMAAGVSEGLIFRHFGNKKGLLDAIMQSGKSQIGVQLDEIRSIDDPAALIQAVLSIPFEVP